MNNIINFISNSKKAISIRFRNVSVHLIRVYFILDKQLTIIVREFFAAWTETTSTTLRWAILFLIHYPECQKKLRENNAVEIGQNEPKMEHKDRLPLVEAFILKVQRQGNIVPFAFPHAPKEDFNFKGYLFPKGTFMFFALDSVMTDPEIFPEPSKFKPERFLD